MDDRRRPDAGHRALRIGRRSIDGQAYFLTTVTRHRIRYFANTAAASAVAAVLAQDGTWHPARVMAWVVMPDHVHALLVLDGGVALDRVVSKLKAVSARACNRALGRSGQVWTPAFHDRALRADESRHAAARYLVANPIRAGLARALDEYPYVWCAWDRLD